MGGNRAFGAAALFLSIAVLRFPLGAQQPQTPPPGGAQQPQRGGGRRGAGGFVPGQTRPPFDQAQVDRGKTLYGISCTGCHGADLRGGDLGGPNLLRSQVALSDQDGELITPILEGSRQSGGMPSMNMKPEDEKAVVAYVHSVISTIGNQGKPPSVGMAPPSV